MSKITRRQSIQAASATLAASLGLGVDTAWADDSDDADKPAPSTGTLVILHDGKVVQELAVGPEVADLVTNTTPITIEIQARASGQAPPIRVKFSPEYTRKK
jgi:hypothetical protein